MSLAMHNEKRMIDTVSYLLAATTRVRCTDVRTCPMMLLSLCSQVGHPKCTNVYTVYNVHIICLLYVRTYVCRYTYVYATICMYIHIYVLV